MIWLVKDNCFTPVKDKWNIKTLGTYLWGFLQQTSKTVLSFLPKKTANLGFQFVFSDLGSRFRLR